MVNSGLKMKLTRDPISVYETILPGSLFFFLILPRILVEVTYNILVKLYRPSPRMRAIEIKACQEIIKL